MISAQIKKKIENVVISIYINYNSLLPLVTIYIKHSVSRC